MKFNDSFFAIGDRALLAASVAFCIAGVARAQSFAKPKVLPPATEAAWIKTVKQHKTKDGATVAEVLAYAQKLRPNRFKVGTFEVGYNGATGLAETVAIGYWVGAKRLPEDSYVDLGYDMTSAGTVKPVAANEPTLVALEGGRDTFLKAVDDIYRDTCQPYTDEPPDC